MINMNWKTIFLTGAAIGTSVGLLMTIITHIPLGNDSDGNQITVMYHWQSALLVVIGIPLVSAFGVNKISKMSGCCEPSLKHLIPVAYLTFLIPRSEEHTSELQSRRNLVCRLLLEKKKNTNKNITIAFDERQQTISHHQH